MIYQPPKMVGENSNHNLPPYQPWLFDDVVTILGI
jgi:hypothetical protein